MIIGDQDAYPALGLACLTDLTAELDQLEALLVLLFAPRHVVDDAVDPQRFAPGVARQNVALLGPDDTAITMHPADQDVLFGASRRLEHFGQQVGVVAVHELVSDERVCIAVRGGVPDQGCY